MRQNNATVTERYFVGTHPVEKSLCVRSSYLVFGETGQLEHTDSFSDCFALCGDNFKDIVVPKSALRFAPVEGEPTGPFPAKDLSMHCAFGP